MTSLGHSLLGITIGICCVPRRTSARWKVGYFAAFVVLSNIPDLPFPHWGHERYDISHNLFVNLLLCLIMVALLGWHPNIRHFIGGGKILGGGVAAWLSHLVLDSFYNHGRGVAIFWPLSDAHLALPIPWFSVVPFPPLSLALLRECAIECASYLPLVALAYILRRSGLFP
jgi:LexA-binding, inner membrane-associated putative hydrolase